jgi:hypothetical protein
MPDMYQPTSTPLQLWIKWRMILSFAILTADLAWVFLFKPASLTVPLWIAALVLLSRVGTDIYLAVKRLGVKPPVNASDPTPDAKPESN